MLGIAGFGLCGWKEIIKPASYFFTDLKKVEPIFKAIGDWKKVGSAFESFTKEGITYYKKGKSKETVLFFGDSNMEQYWPRINKLIEEGGEEVKSALFAICSSCPPIPHLFSTVHPEQKKFVENSLKLAEDPCIKTIVLCASWGSYFIGTDVVYFYGGKENPLRLGSVGEKKALKAMAEMIEAWRRKGKKVYLVLQMPSGRAFEPRSFFSMPSVAFPQKYSETEWRSVSEPLHKKLREMAERAGAVVIDPAGELCVNGECRTFFGNAPIYKDEGHLRPNFVRDHIHFFDALMKK